MQSIEYGIGFSSNRLQLPDSNVGGETVRWDCYCCVVWCVQLHVADCDFDWLCVSLTAASELGVPVTRWSRSTKLLYVEPG